jgi:hypothetical protein
MSELVPRDTELAADAYRLVVPGTGELFDLSDAAHAADAWLALREVERQITELKEMVRERLLEESNLTGTKTLHFDRTTVELRGGSRAMFDIEGLRDALLDAGLPTDRLDEVIRTRVEYRVDQRETAKLAGANPAYAQAIAKHRSVEPAPWTVIVREGRP